MIDLRPLVRSPRRSLNDPVVRRRRACCALSTSLVGCSERPELPATQGLKRGQSEVDAALCGKPGALATPRAAERAADAEAPYPAFSEAVRRAGGQVLWQPQEREPLVQAAVALGFDFCRLAQRPCCFIGRERRRCDGRPSRRRVQAALRLRRGWLSRPPRRRLQSSPDRGRGDCAMAIDRVCMVGRGSNGSRAVGASAGGSGCSRR